LVDNRVYIEKGVWGLRDGYEGSGKEGMLEVLKRLEEKWFRGL